MKTKYWAMLLVVYLIIASIFGWVPMRWVQSSLAKATTAAEAAASDTSTGDFPAAEAKAEEVIEQEELEETETVVVEIPEFDSQWNYDGRDGAKGFFVEVEEPGDTAAIGIFCEKQCSIVDRISPDDELVRAYVIEPTGTQRELVFELLNVPAGGTGNEELDKQLRARGVNIEDGEILMQSLNPVAANAVAGSYIVFEVKDAEELAVNVGLFVQLK